MTIPSRGAAFRLAPLAASLSMALALGSTPIPSLATNRVVQNCGDGGAGSGSLRDMVGVAASGDVIDLTELPTKCGMTDSTITLSNGEIVIAQQDLKLYGPSVGSVTIRPAAGGPPARVLSHTGTGLLVVQDLALANGNNQAGANVALGGCIGSNGDLFFNRAMIKDCTASSDDAAYGGGIFASGAIVLLDSKVSGNNALGSSFARGGGVYSQGLSILYSTLSDNQTSGSGGAVFASSVTPGVYTYIANSTLEGNTAANCGAAGLYTTHGATLSNSTISGNTATYSDGGLCLEGSGYVLNSTIAFNTAPSHSGGLAVAFGYVDLQSSIVARNGAIGVPDLFLLANSSAGGSDNLVNYVIGTVQPGVIKVTSDPKLDPQLRFNGGRTQTHALLRSSPAIGAGNDYAGWWTDQRGRGYPRATGPNVLTDIGAFQFDSIFFEDFDG